VTQITPTTAAPDKFASYREMRTGLRSDLQITRQWTKGEPFYVIYDPVSFQSHRLSLTDYRVAACLDEARTLDQAFQATVADKHLSHEDEADFFQFISRLESLGLLTISSRDGKALFNRFKHKTSDAAKARLLGFLFVTIPLSNPDKFLDRTVARFRFLFCTKALLVWSVLGAFAVALIVNKWSEFVKPLNGLLAVKNLLFMSLAFVALKVWHELGHGYACKHFGGRVPEMGCKLMAGMPLAYVDASSAWSFPKRAHRIVVMLGGMYFESLVAIPAAFIWASSPDSFIGACAYQLIFMAGVATVFFNANPLMKYDGYFVLSDMLGIPNLRARSQRETMNTLKHYALGLELDSRAVNRTERVSLLSYGVLSNLYAMALMVSIPLMLASRFQVLGLVIGAIQISTTLLIVPKKLHDYLFHSSETQPVRSRARCVGYGLTFGVPLVLLFPIPTGVRIDGVVSAEQSTVVRAKTPGIVLSIDSVPRTEVVVNQPLMSIENLDAQVAAQAETTLANAALRSAHFVSRLDVAEGAKRQAVATERQLTARSAQASAEELTIRAPHNGRLTAVLPQRAVGSYVVTGDPVARLVSGKTIVRAWLDEGQLNSANLKVGSTVNVRLADRASHNYCGTILSVAPANAAEFEDLSLTTSGEGDILIDPLTGVTAKSLFQIQVAVSSLNSENVHQEARAFLLVGRNYESIGHWLIRHIHKFVTSIFTN
jgi:putative peptide zinc metalloprotease protein